MRKARKSFLFTEGSLTVENKKHLFDFVVTLIRDQITLNKMADTLIENVSVKICFYIQIIIKYEPN